MTCVGRFSGEPHTRLCNSIRKGTFAVHPLGLPPARGLDWTPERHLLDSFTAGFIVLDICQTLQKVIFACDNLLFRCFQCKELSAVNFRKLLLLA